MPSSESRSTLSSDPPPPGTVIKRVWMVCWSRDRTHETLGKGWPTEQCNERGWGDNPALPPLPPALPPLPGGVRPTVNGLAFTSSQEGQ